MGPSEEAGRDVSRGGGDARRRVRRRTLALGLALTAAALAVTFSHGAEHRTGTNGIPARTFVGTATDGDTLCQAGESLPAGTAALRFSAAGSSHATPRLTVTLENGGGVQAESADARWDGDDAIVVAFARPLPADAVADVCVRLHADERQTYAFNGTETYLEEGATQDGQPLPGRMHLEYLAGDGGSWWSIAPTIARRLGRGHAWSGASVALLAALLTLTSIAASAWLLGRTDR